jgi:hypothetical protein
MVCRRWQTAEDCARAREIAFIAMREKRLRIQLNVGGQSPT